MPTPEPKTVAELTAFIQDTLAADHDYETSAQALHDITVAAFNVAARALGSSGFQASWAALRFLGTVNSIDGPYAVVKAEDMVYPQYPTLADRAAQLEREWTPWAADQAREKLAELQQREADGLPTHPKVIAHWEQLDRDNPVPSSRQIGGDR